MHKPDELRADKGNGRLSKRADREFRELRSDTHPRQRLSPLAKLEVMDERVALQGEDEDRTHFDPNVHPRAFNGMADLSDPVADDKGRLVDVEADTGSIGVDIGPTDKDVFLDGLPELGDLDALEPVDSDGDLLDDLL